MEVYQMVFQKNSGGCCAEPPGVVWGLEKSGITAETPPFIGSNFLMGQTGCCAGFRTTKVQYHKPPPRPFPYLLGVWFHTFRNFPRRAVLRDATGGWEGGDETLGGASAFLYQVLAPHDAPMMSVPTMNIPLLRPKPFSYICPSFPQKTCSATPLHVFFCSIRHLFSS